MPITLGHHAPQLDAVRALRTKAGRTEHRRYVIEGVTLLEEALRAGLVPEAVYATEAAYAKLPSHARGTAEAAKTFLLAERTLARLSDLDTPPGLIAVLPLALGTLDEMFEHGSPVLLLAGISDPGNAGTLLRSAEIFGVRAAVFGALGVDSHAPKVVRATMGAFFRMSLASATPDEVMAAAERHRYDVIAATRSGQPLPGFTFPARSVLAIGNERHGIEGWLPRFDAGLAIPQTGAGESLNAAVAGSIILYAFSQQLTPSIK